MNLSYGSRGDEVKKLQQALNSTGKYTLDVDGSYGPATQSAVRDYQTQNGLKVDGIAGNETLGKLYQTPTPTQPQQPAQQMQQPAPTQQTKPTFYEQPTQNAGYKQASESYQKALQEGAPQYNSTYDAEMKAIYDKIMTRDPFSYNLANDPMYSQYRDQYTQQGQMAMMDTMGQAAALTGGYGSTYGQAVGQQQYNAYLQQMNQIIPELYDRAYGRYQQEGQDLLDQYALTGDLAADEYAKYQDAYQRYWDNIGFLQGEEDKAYERAMEADQLGYERQQDAYNRVLGLVQMGYMPSDAELAAAGMSKDEANYWSMLYQQQMAGSGGRGGGYDEVGTDGDDDWMSAVATQMGAQTNLADRLAVLDSYKTELTSNEYRELYNALIVPYEKNGAGGGNGHGGRTEYGVHNKHTNMTR